MQPATRTIQYRPGARILERIGARVKGRCVSGLRRTSAGPAEGFSFDIGVQRSSACGATNQGSLKCVKTAICEGNVWPVKKGSAATQIQSDTPLVSFACLRGKKGVLRAPSWPFVDQTAAVLKTVLLWIAVQQVDRLNALNPHRSPQPSPASTPATARPSALAKSTHANPKAPHPVVAV